MTKLSVNVNKVATLRNTRPKINIPDVVRCATICLDAGAHGITIHPRPDQRHIKRDDVGQIAALLKRYPGREFNIEGNPFIDYMPCIEQARPTQATLVPDTTEAFTSDHGWDLRNAADADRLRPVIRRLRDLGARVSLFMNPVPDQIPLAKALGADRIELYTEPYATAFAHAGAAEPYAEAAQAAIDAGLEVNAGHDLNLQNLAPFLAAVPQIAEVSIGHALIADALEFGLAQTVRRYLAACGH